VDAYRTRANARIVDENIDPTKCFDYALNRIIQDILFGDIGNVDVCDSTGSLDRRDGFTGTTHITIKASNRRSGARKRHGKLAAQPTTCARHQDNLFMKTKG
jgi:hypothetical protein